MSTPRLLVNSPSPELCSNSSKVCGIGNQGAAYRTHRHSIGQFIIGEIRSRLCYPAWEKSNACKGYFSNLDGPCVLFKTNYWMNQSGLPVKAAYKNVGGANWGQLCVIYDDLELA